jgi:hypothetical protein
MSIQVTPIPRLTVLTSPAFTLGTTNTAGSAITGVASDSTLLTFDTTLPDAITFGQSGAVGAATVASRRDHSHATATVDAATQAEMEAASSTTVFDTPGRTQYHPGVVKAWANFNGTGTAAIRESHNCTLTDNGTGDYTLTFGTDFANTDFAVVISGRYSDSVGQQNKFRCPQARAVDTIRVNTTDAGSDPQDHLDVMVACYGDQ